ncbi:nicotinate phosphoribosyltransferase [Agromyces marinus]|uniref:Nicotinate phosphoribosyltransferase n=1 Tax=Agromyces marinus TaxID=1389020 RepID=A0ABM8H5H2_9MICO|nr:nicotinate phosphoribosyltransferase [Agromyces marinus]UIP59026.1 Nicotinate phosphoribosyltransferase pncB1 [Agromyces marinus]BDZ55998.1 nicotinate phosphoribosyltransferase [Agromyces marinus]
MTGSAALFTDRYELTMVDAALLDGTAHRESLFEAFARRLPDGRRYGVVAGTGRLLELVERFRFGDDELEFLRAERVVRDETLDWLADYRFRGEIWGYREGEAYFPGSPLVTVQGSFAEAVILETLVLSVLNYDSAVAGAAARMVSVALGRPIAEMGSRRANERSAVAAARAAYIAGFDATSNLEAGRRWGIPTMGTAAHSFTLLHDSEEDAFRAQVEAMGPGTTLLVDTYDIRAGVETAVRVAGTGLGAVRIDSGDLPTVAAAVREHLDELGAVNTRITVTSDLDEHAIASLASAPVDAYGVGTSVVTGSGFPAAGMVYKLVARRGEDGAWVGVAKASTSKTSVGGRKNAARRIDATRTAREELVYVGDGPGGEDEFAADDRLRPLMVHLMHEGEADAAHVGPAGVRAARAHRAEVMQELPIEAFRLGRGEPVIPTTYR